MINGTDLSVTDVAWPGYPPLFALNGDSNQPYHVMQLHFWSPILHTWVKLVSVKSGEVGVVEVTPSDIQAIQQYEAQGVPKTEAIRRVLGILPGQ